MSESKISKNERIIRKETQDKFVIDFKDGPIVSKVWLVEGRDGTSFLKFTVHRLFKSKTSENWLSPRDYFARNRDALHQAVDLACDFLDEHEGHPEQALVAADELIERRQRAQEAEAESAVEETA